MDHSQDDDRASEQRSHRIVPDEAPDPVETRDPDSRPTPRRSRAWLFAIPPVVLALVGLFWMFRVEGDREGAQSAPYSVAGTSGERDNDPEGLGRGDETPLNPDAGRPQVIGDMELLTAKEDYVGRAVAIPAIPVMGTPGPRTLWVGRPMNRTLVLLDRNFQGLGTLSAGQPVQVRGRLEKRPDKNAIDRAGLHEDDRKALEAVDVFIRATAIEPQQRTGPVDAPTRQ
jgi:hypothetical protein